MSTTTPTATMPFGEHKGILLIDKRIPFAYLLWAQKTASKHLKLQIASALVYRANN